MVRPYKRELAYLEGTGTQWIETGITPSSQIHVSCTYYWDNDSGDQVLFGCRENGSSSLRYYYFHIRTAYGALRDGYGAAIWDVGVSVTGKFTIVKNANVSTWNGITHTFSNFTFDYSDMTISLFCLNRLETGSHDWFFKGKIYSFKASLNGVALRDFIPVLDNNDVPCMYDRVSKQLFYNQGTGTFLYGEKPAVVVYNPIPYRMNPLSAGFSPSELTFTARQAGSTITLNKTGSPNVSGLQYKTKSLDWTSYTIGDTITLTNAGDYVKFQNTNNTLSTSNSNYVTFSMTGEIGASGNIQSMVNYQTTAPDYCFRKLFQGCSSLVTPPDMPATSVGSYSYGGMYSNSGVMYAPDLPATTVGSYCYYYMFENAPIKRLGELPAATLATNCYQAMCINCSELVKGPSVLPAGTLLQNCYYSMFEGCAKLIHSAKISATVINGTNVCRSMYKGCSSLVDAHVPQATVLKNYCYHSMYQNCISLKVPPALPATTLADYCYNVMFSNSGLTSIPELPATTLATSCYHTMFYGCADLTGSVSLPASTLVAHCYDYMWAFTKVTGIEVNFTEWTANGTAATDGWVNSLKSSTGTFTKPSALSEETGSSRIPANWTIVNKD